MEIPVDLAPEHVSLGAGSSSGPGSGPGAGVQAQAQPVSKRDAFPASSNDEKDLVSVLGLDAQLAPVPQVLPDLLKAQVAFKWQPRTQGGWFTGTITRLYNDFDQPGPDIERRPLDLKRVNVLIHYPIDSDTRGPTAHLLSVDNMVSRGTAAINTWGLIVGASLSNYTSAHAVLAPLSGAKKAGRPQSKRKKSLDEVVAKKKPRTRPPAKASAKASANAPKPAAKSPAAKSPSATPSAN